MSVSLDKSLTVAQRQAVQHVDGPLLILAGPGSGKTRVVTQRVAHLLQVGVPPRSILALTFTNKAADEMKARIARLASEKTVWVSTFHRFCSRLLRQHASLVGLSENFTIYDTNDSLRALKHAIEGLEELQLSQTTPEKIAREISRCKNELITAEQYRPRTRNALGSLLADVYPAYQRQLRQSNAVDFDDLLLYTVELLMHNNELRRELDEQYRYVMVDEYQDTNLAQYAIVRALSIDQPNLAVTGDPDQSIYSWRGANLNNILEFERDYPNVQVVRLEQNYRSTPEILRVADCLIQRNVRRKKKELFTNNDSGPLVRLPVFPNQFDEARYIADDIIEQVESGRRRYRDFAIFYRINALSRYLEHTLHERGVPYQILNGVEFYQRKEVKDVVAYLQLINNHRDDMALLRVINTPTRGLGKTTVSRVADFARRSGTTLLEAARQSESIDAISHRAAGKLRRFVEMIDRFTELATAPVEEILGHVLSESGYEEHLAESDQRADEDRSANIRELLSAARQFDDLSDGLGNLEGFLEQTSLVSDTDAWEDESDKVTLMTLHAAKGLEFPAVYIVALEQGKLPHERSRHDPEQLEEERRLLFVGITRAQHQLQLSYAKYRDFRGQLSPTVPSAFLMELPRADMEITEPTRAASYPEDASYPKDWDDFDGQDEADWSVDEPASEMDADSSPTETADESVPAITTAADLAGARKPAAPQTAADPNDFYLGIRVNHPEYGLGKVVALSGSEANRTATVNFATSGQKKFVLAKSPLRPLG